MARVANEELQLSLEGLRRAHVLGVLAHCCGNVTHAAAILGIHRQSLQRLLRRWGTRGDRVETVSAGTLADVEDWHIAATLARSGGNITHAARRLGLRRQSLQRMLKKIAVPLAATRAERSADHAIFARPSDLAIIRR